MDCIHFGFTTRLRNTLRASSCRSRTRARGRVAAVAEELSRVPTRERTNGGDHSAVVLHVVVAVENVVLPVVLVLGGDYDLAEPRAEFVPRRYAEILPRVCVAAPRRIYLGKVVYRLPVALVQHAQDACAVRSGLAAKDAEQRGVAGAFGGLVVGG